MKKYKTSSLPSRISVGFLIIALIASTLLSGITLIISEPQKTILAASVIEQVGAGSDDIVVYYTTSWQVILGGVGLSVGDFTGAGSDRYGVGVRFTTVNVPQGATITNSYLQFYAHQTLSADIMRAKIRGQDSDDAATFTGTYANYNSRPRTTATCYYDLSPTWTANNWYTVDDDTDGNINDIIQEIVDRPGWVANNDMVLFFDDHDARSDAHALRQGKSYEESSTFAPKLYIAYVAVVAPTVTTSAASSIEETTVTLNANLTNTGGENNDEQGFDYDIDSGAPYANEQTSAGSFGTGVFDEDITGLTEGELYYFRGKSHNSAGWGYGSELTFLTKPLVPTSFNAVANTCGTINLSWVKGTGADNTEIWGKTGSYPSARGDGSLTYNSTGTSHTDTNPVSDETWYYRAWSYATEGGKEQYSDSYAASSAASNCQPPTLATYNTSQVGETWATLNGSITNVGVENADVRGFQWDIDTGSPYTYNWTQDGDYGIGEYTYNSTGLTEGELYYYRGCANNSDGWGYGNEVTFLTKPNPPTNLANTSSSSTTIDFSWTNGNGSQKVLIRYGNSTYPTTISEGTQGFFDSGTTGTVSGLTLNTTYYFSAWGYATEGGREQYSNSYDTDIAATIIGPLVSTVNATLVEETTATLRGNVTAINGGNITVRGFEWDTDSGTPYTGNWTQSGNYSLGLFTHGLTLLTKGDAYYYRAKAKNDNNDWGYGSQMAFMTKPDEPTALNVTAHTATSISLSWTKGEGADNTIIMSSTTGYPTDYVGVTGTEVYNGIGTSVTVPSLSPGQIYYFSAWSYAEEDTEHAYSDAYDTVTDYTNPSDVTNLDAYNPSDTSIDLSWNKGTGGDQTHVRSQTAGYPSDVTDGSQVYFGSASSTDYTSLTTNTTYYFRAWAYDSDSGYYSDGYDQDYETTTGVGATPTPTPTVTTTTDTGTMFIAFVLLPLGLFTIGLYWKKIWIVSAASIAFFGLGMFGLTEGSAGEGLWIIGMLCTIFAMLVALFAFFRMREKVEPEEVIEIAPDEEYENELNREKDARKEARRKRRDEGDLL